MTFLHGGPSLLHLQGRHIFEFPLPRVAAGCRGCIGRMVRWPWGAVRRPWRRPGRPPWRRSWWARRWVPWRPRPPGRPGTALHQLLPAVVWRLSRICRNFAAWEEFQLCSCQEFRVPKSILKNLKATSSNLKAQFQMSSLHYLFTTLLCLTFQGFVSCRPSGNSLWDRQLVTILSFLWTFWSSLISRLVTDEVAQAWGATCQRSFRGI